MRLLILISFSLVLNIQGVFANNIRKIPEPDSTKIYSIETNDRNLVIGHLIEKDEVKIVMQTKTIARFEIEINTINSIDEIEEIEERNYRKGRNWFANHSASRYFVGPSSFNLKKGEGYYQNTLVLLNSINYGITDYFSIGGGFELLSFFSGEPIVFLMPKASFQLSDDFYLGLGLLYISYPTYLYDYEREQIAIFYGSSTFGNKDDNITAGIGWGYLGDNLMEMPVGTLSGATRIGKKISLISENYFFPRKEVIDDINVPSGSYEVITPYPVFSYGIRFQFRQFSIDLGFVNNDEISSEIAIGIPFFNFAVKF